MIRKFTFIIFFFCPVLLFAQNLTGIWRGWFNQKDFNSTTGNFIDDTYKYEIQINQHDDNSVDGVTYSYKKTEFYGKASLHGLVSQKTKNIIIKEIRLIEHHSANSATTTCLMTCYFDYVKRGKLEILTGTYTSISADATNTNNCGEGTVYLEKVAESDFDKESFLTNKQPNHSITKVNKDKKTNTNKDKNTTAIFNNKNNSNSLKKVDNQVDNKNKSSSKSIAKSSDPIDHPVKKHIITDHKNSSTPKTRTDSISNAINLAKIKPGAETFVLKNKVDNEIDTFYKFKIDTTVYVYDSPNNKHSLKNKSDSSSKKKDSTLKDKNISTDTIVKIPKQLKDRDNPVINTIEVDEKEVKIDYYDNGEIDNDTISVYDNNVNVIKGGRLSWTPITLNLVFSKEVPVHEIITVAENLGDIPPNTALMVITYANKRYEVFITSDEKTNAKVILKYKPKTKENNKRH